MPGCKSGSSRSSVGWSDMGTRRRLLRLAPARHSGRRHNRRSNCSATFLGLPAGANMDKIGTICSTGESHEAKIAKTIAVIHESS